MTAHGIHSQLPLRPSMLRASVVFKRFVHWINIRREAQAGSQRLRVAERVTIGEKSAVAVVHVDGRRFLLASGQTMVSLIAELSPEETFSSAMKKTVAMSQQEVDRPRTRRPRAAKINKEDVAA